MPTDEEFKKATAPRAGANPALVSVQLHSGEIWQIDKPVPVMSDGKIVEDKSMIIYRIFELANGAVDVFVLPKIDSPQNAVSAAMHIRLPAMTIRNISRILRIDVWKATVQDMVEIESVDGGTVDLDRGDLREQIAAYLEDKGHAELADAVRDDDLDGEGDGVDESVSQGDATQPVAPVVPITAANGSPS